MKDRYLGGGSMLVLAMVLTACGAQEQGAEIYVDPEAVGSAKLSVDAAGQPFEVVSLEVGRYVDGQTFKVGGIGKTFKQSDAIYAAVKWHGNAAGVELSARIVDKTGTSVAQQTLPPRGAGQVSANFTLRALRDAEIAPGEYAVEVIEGSAVRASQQIKIEG